jgi:pimeloyl-ACP methyl ester carboxylesterase
MTAAIAKIVRDDLVQHDRFITARDGVLLHVTETKLQSGHNNQPALPVFCLPHIDRTAREFSQFATETAVANPGRRIFCLEGRGRGESRAPQSAEALGFDRDCEDLMDTITALGLEHAHFIGSGYGGLVAMSLASSRPGALKSLSLIDAAPAIDGEGLARLQYRMKRTRSYKTRQSAISDLKELDSSRFPNWKDADYEASIDARFTKKEIGKRSEEIWVPDLSDNYLNMLINLDLGERLGDKWNLWQGLARIPLLLVRAENSSLVSEQSWSRMREDRSVLTAPTGILNLKGQGSVPLLGGKWTEKLHEFLS